MGRIDVVIADDLETKLRMKAVTDFGGKKGSLQSAIEEALRRYTEEPRGKGHRRPSPRE